MPEDAQDVTLPHDAMIHEKAHKESPNSGMTGYRDGDYYTYVKELNYSPAETGENVILQFEGVYKDAFVFVNGEYAGKEHSGYTTFSVDISDFLKEGTNEIRVQVHNGDMPNSRWYSGGGIYRDVYLLTSEKLCIKPDGVKIRTENPEVFLKAADFLSEEPGNCVVVEDAYSGVDAAKAGGMIAVGIGEASGYEKTDYPIKSFGELLDIKF